MNTDELNGIGLVLTEMTMQGVDESRIAAIMHSLGLTGEEVAYICKTCSGDVESVRRAYEMTKEEDE